ncbi:MAG: class I SAM-dependent methyltransferase [Bdellovibrionaceae bacterium]|nr:class I SAM-dependent methyltransferase [Pseudobdellovibrionaceae bacterium]
MSTTLEQRRPILLQLGFREAALPQLQSYLDLLWSANEELNLISRKMTFDDLIDNHVIDCLLPLRHFPTDVKAVADFGSGGGLPGVLYAIQFPDVRFELFEKSKLKQEFLRRATAIAPNLKVNADIPPRLPEIDLVTARAFKPIDVILQLSRAHAVQGGRYFLLKGRLEKIEEELRDARKIAKDVKTRIEILKSPVLDVERHLVLIGGA